MKFGLLLTFICSIFWCYAQNQIIEHYTYAKRAVEVLPNNIYVENVLLEGENLSGAAKLYIPYGELDKLEDLTISYLNEKGKVKSVSSKEIIDQSIYSNSHYSGYRAKVVELPLTSMFKVTYKRKSYELLFIAGIYLNQADVVEYSLLLPAAYRFEYLLDSSLREIVAVDSSFAGEMKKYLFEKRENKDVLSVSTIPTIVYPADFDSGWRYLSDWYYTVGKNDESLTLETMEVITEKIGPIDDMDQLAITRSIFQLVQKEINYIDIENGMEAIIPRRSNDVYAKRLGDCKDMSNLICQLCRHYGIDCEMAISSSISNDWDLIFPSLSCANHVIAVANIEGRSYLLDATDEYCEFGSPSQHIQGRKIFVANESGGQQIDVPVISAADNRNVDSIVVYVTADKKIAGRFNQTFNGLSGSHLKYALGSKGPENFQEIYTYYLNETWKGITASISEVEETDSLIVTGELVMSGKLLTSIGNQRLLSLNFLPKPHQIYINQEEDDGNLYATINKRVIVDLHFSESISITEEGGEEFQEGPFSFIYTINQKGDQTLEISYQFICDDIDLDKSEIRSFVTMDQKIDDFLSKKILYEIR